MLEPGVGEGVSPCRVSARSAGWSRSMNPDRAPAGVAEVRVEASFWGGTAFVPHGWQSLAFGRASVQKHIQSSAHSNLGQRGQFTPVQLGPGPEAQTCSAEPGLCSQLRPHMQAADTQRVPATSIGGLVFVSVGCFALSCDVLSIS